MLGTEHLWRLSSDRAGGAHERIEQLAKSFGLAVDPDAKVGDLSVGERQRVEILKALYRDARILILDEPTAVLTPQESVNLFATLKQLTADGLSIIFISHKLNEVMTASDRIYVLRVGQHRRRTREDGDQPPGACRTDGGPADARAQGREAGARRGAGRT